VAQAQLGGKLAQVGSRLIDNIAKKISDDFFVAFNKQVMLPAPIPALEPARVPEPTLALEPTAASVSASPAAFAAPAAAFRVQITELVPWWAWLAIGVVVGAAALHWFGGS